MRIERECRTDEGSFLYFQDILHFSFLVFLEDINFIWDINGLALDVIDTHELQQSGCMMISFPIGTLALMRSIFE